MSSNKGADLAEVMGRCQDLKIDMIRHFQNIMMSNICTIFR